MGDAPFIDAPGIIALEQRGSHFKPYGAVLSKEMSF
jgi:hypothetical protein